MMKNLVVYYSLEGNTKLVAEAIAKEIGADILELRPKKEFPSSGFIKYLWGGKSVIFKQKPDLVNEEIDLNKYDNIFLGTPVWAGTYAAPFNTFLDGKNISNKNIAIFTCHGGGGSEKCFANFKKSLADNIFIGEIELLDPLKKETDKNLDKVKSWIKTLNI
jgi:flavodoxin